MGGELEGAERILEGLAEFRQQLSRGAEELEAALSRLSFYQRFDEEIKRPIEEAHRIAREIRRRAEEEAVDILRQARQEAEGLREEIVRVIDQLEEASKEVDRTRAQAEEQVRRRLAALAEEEAAVLAGIGTLREALDALANKLEAEERRAREKAEAIVLEAKAKAEADYEQHLRQLEDTKRKLEEEIRELQLSRMQVASDLERTLVDRLAFLRQQRLASSTASTIVLISADAHPARVVAAIETLALAVGATKLGHPRLQNNLVAIPIVGEDPQHLLQKLQAAWRGPLPFRTELRSAGELFIDLSMPALTRLG